MSDALDQYVYSWLGDRQHTVIEHGDTSTRDALPWWSTQLSKNNMADIRLTMDPTGQGSSYISRGDLFEFAAREKTFDDQSATLSFLWHVVLWGSGAKHSRIAPKINSFADIAQRRHHVSLLQQAARVAKAGDIGAAYTLLRPNSRAAIRNLGPSYFTKFLYFATGGETALILDQKVATNLQVLKCPTAPSNSSSSSSTEYVTYCQTLRSWADLITANGTPCQADELERALFAGVPRGPKATKTVHPSS